MSFVFNLRDKGVFLFFDCNTGKIFRDKGDKHKKRFFFPSKGGSMNKAGQRKMKMAHFAILKEYLSEVIAVIQCR